MHLSEVQRDSLTELINIGYARAAGALSQLTGYRIGLEVPKVAVHDLHEVPLLVSESAPGQALAVSQIFSGHVSGNALLVMTEHSANTLVALLTDRVPEVQDWPENRREVMSEVGNIVLNACLGVFGNLLQVQVTFALPLVQTADVTHILQSLTVGRENLSHALVIQTRFHVRQKDLSGCLVIVLGVTSLDRLLRGLDDWEKRSVEG